MNCFTGYSSDYSLHTEDEWRESDSSSEYSLHTEDECTRTDSTSYSEGNKSKYWCYDVMYKVEQILRSITN